MSNDKLTLGVGLAQELEHAFNRNGYESLDEIKELTKGDFLGQVRSVRLGLSEIKPVEHAVDLGAGPFLPDGWEVEEHQKSKVVKLERRGPDLYLDGKKIDFYLSKKQKSGCIAGNDFRKELANKPVLNANILDYLLKNPHLIPEEWEKDENGNIRHIYFWGTIYRHSGGHLYVRYLYWYDDRWRWYYDWLVDGWHSRSPAAVLAS